MVGRFGKTGLGGCRHAVVGSAVVSLRVWGSPSYLRSPQLGQDGLPVDGSAIFRLRVNGGEQKTQITPQFFVPRLQKLLDARQSIIVFLVFFLRVGPAAGGVGALPPGRGHVPQRAAATLVPGGTPRIRRNNS